MRDKRSKLQIYFDVFSAILIEKQDKEAKTESMEEIEQCVDDRFHKIRIVQSTQYILTMRH
ncbi:hypothetical protein OAU56_05070 [Nitrosopumilus sp.]|nr:hypothetical protein [Nitrosopumilus sp.]